MSENTPNSLTKTGYRDFAIIVFLLAVIRAVLPFIAVPLAIAKAVDFLLLVGVFVSTIYAIYRAMSEQPKPKLALMILLIGVFLHLGAANVVTLVFQAVGPGAILFSAIAQTGLMIWCIGLGALISSLLRDKNILIPVAIFLVGFDIFLVLTPLGFTKQLIKQNPNLLATVGMQIPKSTHVANEVAKTTVATAGLVGPADLVFLGAFFLAMFRFDMRPKETLRVMIPTLIGYMILVLFTGWALPALVPIGLVTLIVNRDQFNLNKDEKASTVVLALIVVTILTFSATRKPKSPTEPLPSVSSEVRSKPANSPEPTNSNQPRLTSPTAPQSKPNPL